METSLCTNVHELKAYLHKTTFIPENSDISYTITAFSMLTLTCTPSKLQSVFRMSYKSPTPCAHTHVLYTANITSYTYCTSTENMGYSCACTITNEHYKIHVILCKYNNK